jgi:hypothetical protein
MKNTQVNSKPYKIKRSSSAPLDKEKNTDDLEKIDQDEPKVVKNDFKTPSPRSNPDFKSKKKLNKPIKKKKRAKSVPESKKNEVLSYPDLPEIDPDKKLKPWEDIAPKNEITLQKEATVLKVKELINSYT